MDRTTLAYTSRIKTALVGRKQTAPKQSWTRYVDGEFINPQPGRTYIKQCWPPRGRGRGESLTSPRRIQAKQRAGLVLQLRAQGYTWSAIAQATGFRDASGAYRAAKRAVDRADWDQRRRDEFKRQSRGGR